MIPKTHTQTRDGLLNFAALFAKQPKISATVLILTLLGMLTDGLSLLLLLPLLSFFTEQGTTDTLSIFIFELYDLFGIHPNLPSTLLIFLTIMFARAIIRLSKDLATTRLRTVLLDDLRNQTMSAFIKAEWQWLSAHKRSDQGNTVLTEVQRVAVGINAALTLLATGAAVLAYLAVACGISLKVTLSATLIGASLFLVFSKQRRKAIELGTEQLNVNRNLHHKALEILNALKLSKILGTQDSHILHFQAIAAELRYNQMQFALMSGLTREAFQLAGAFLLVGYIFWGSTIQQTPISELLVIVFIFARLVPMLTSLQQYLHILLNALPALNDVSKALRDANTAAEPAWDGSEPFNEVQRDLRLEAITLNFPDQKQAALRDATLILPKGSITAITGPSGAGKSCLADVLMGLLTPEKGALYVDDIPIFGSKRIAWRQGVAYVPQDATLYSGTIEDNLRHAHTSASEEDICAALRSASAEFVFDLPDGLKTYIGDGARDLSGGERQRIALARGLIRKPQLLILDEVTSALDLENERRILSSIAALHGAMTIVILGHRIPFLEIADQIVHMHQGQIISVKENR